MRKSALTDDFDHCFICGQSGWIEMHHIFGGSNRKNSDADELIVPLCHYHHTETPNGVHHNKDNMNYLHKVGQTYYEEHIGTREDFMKRYGKNYL